ncbi:glycosyltransferase family 4 protein [Gordonia amicalis]|uniref:glycosyltransferase family 4 protein n=1 Tax=Gordonia amicalis TaxID=89053 RepID=UPI0029538DB0|nr:glycosyltransferase family 4 protein [Gordonia amicalis]MDV7102067.1 glycosyltransferase family 4 protein [Gordonia amicalis]
MSANPPVMHVGYLVETPITQEKRLFGAQISFLALLSQLSDRGVRPFVVVSEEWELTRELNLLGIDYLVTPIWEFFRSIDGAYDGVHGDDLELQITQTSLPKIRDYFSSNSVELVHMNTRFCGLLGAKVAKQLGIPYIFHIREFLADDFGLEFKNEDVANKIIGESTVLIGVSKAIGTYLKTIYPNTRVKIIENGVDTDKYSVDRESRLIGSPVRIAIAGRIIDHKGQVDAVRAVECLAEKYGIASELLIIGHRPEEMTNYESDLLQYVHEAGLANSIEFVPFTDDVPRYLATCDIGLMCSNREAFGRVTVEYMLASLVTIGARNGGTADILEHNINGFLYEKGHPDEIADIIAWCIENPERATQIADRGHKDARQRYTVERNASLVFETYNEILQELP